MSRNPNIRFTTYLDTPPEVLLSLLSHMDHSSRINVANAYPEVFLRPGFNVYVQDADNQVRRQSRHTDHTVPLVVSRSMRPLLYQALEDGVDNSIIEGMLRVYTDHCPTSIDGIWGLSPTTLPPPLIHAASLGRPRAVSLLLLMGANPLLRCGPHNYRSAAPDDCQFAAITHAVCQPLNQATQPHRTRCTTALGAAFFKGIALRTVGQEHRDLESCALVLYRAGVPIPSEGAQPSLSPDTALQQKIDIPIRAGFCDLLKAILEPLLPSGRDQHSFRVVLYYGLAVAVNYQKTDDHRNIIDYLISIGSLIVPTSTTLPYFNDTLAHFASRLAHLKTANFFLNQYIDLGLKLEYGTFNLCRSSDTLPFVQSLYRAMSQGGYLHLQPASAKDLHEYLVARATRDKDDASIEWLAEQQVGTSMNVHYAIIRNNIIALRALIGAGLPVNAETSIENATALKQFALYLPYPSRATVAETPLNLALRLKRFPMACFLIHHGAKPSLLSDKVKKDLIADFLVRYQMPYADSRPKASPAMLRPEYFDTYDADRAFDMYFYILG
ncbi:hypothetical protein FHL15_008247 [Xylaria flabelliformis]|uniref:Uncharacterized protein n=1 Tax=Xylaria flabelliformis TaxID=2512241 RepID=A0A553HSC3_9PEZI|nr:hypothetical protein FHL15_008247 [Xylaria flabelliformis]